MVSGGIGIGNRKEIVALALKSQLPMQSVGRGNGPLTRNERLIDNKVCLRKSLNCLSFLHMSE